MKIDRYLFAVIVIAVAAAMRIWPLDPLGTRLAWLTFYPALMIVAVYGGFYAGLLATGLACLAVTFLWPLLSATPFIKDAKDLLGMAVFVLTGAMISGVAEGMLRANLRAKKSEEKYRALFDKSPLPKWVFSNDSLRFLLVNDAAVRHYGYSREEFMDMTMNDIRPAEDVPALKKLMAPILEGNFLEGNNTGEARHKKKNGEVINVKGWLWPFEMDGQKASLVIIQDITAQKEAENKMKEAKEVAENASKAKSEFLANMSHEIRTPLNAIIGMADLLAETRMDDEQKRYLHVFRGASETLLYLINDILDLAKIEAGQLDIEEAEFDLKETLDLAAAIVSPRARQKGLLLSVSVERPFDHYLLGDSVRLRQVLLNLMSNAVKFSSRGTILVNVVCGQQGDGSQVEIAVTDQGVGIPQEKQRLLFERFRQADASVTRKYGGTGLGLAISKMLVEKMGGDIRLQSEPGKGSTFTFTARFKPGRLKGPAAPDNDLAGMPLLIYFEDDAEGNRIAGLLEGRGILIRRAASESELKRELAAASAAGASIEVVLAFCNVGRGSACTIASEKGRALFGIGNARMLTITSECLCENRPEGGALGPNCCLVSPVGGKDLIRELGKIWGERNRGNIMAGLGGMDAGQCILLVEDAKDNQLLIKAYLKKSSYKVELAQNGQEAVDMFMAGSYDLVLMDVQMPVKDGYTATKEIRVYEKAKGKPRTPIIALTANAYQEDVNNSIEAGCDAHLTKPIKKDKLLAAIEAVFR